MPAPLAWPMAVAALLASGGAPLAAQATFPTGAPADPGDPAWTERWSPLTELADLPRRLPGGHAVFPSLLTLPAPRIGLFWTAGNPAALPDEVEETRVGFRIERVDVSGEYRRPLDPGAEEHLRFDGLGWRPLGDGAAVGRVVVNRQSLDQGVFSDVILPYSSSPFPVLDTLGDAMNRTAVRLEGAGGWRVGALSLGLSLGYEAQEAETVESPVPRTNRTTVPGVVGGVSFPISGGVRIGASARWRQRTHNLTVFSIAAPSRIFAPTGYEEPIAFNVLALAFQRRFERNAWAAGVGVSGRVGAVSWVAYGQRESLSEDRFSPITNDPVTDRWTADGWTLGTAAQLRLGTALLLSLDARYVTLDGEGERGDIELVNFSADEERLDVEGELRLLPTASWEAAARARIVREARFRRDLIGRTFSEIDSWEPAAAAEVARHFGDRFALGLGGGVSFYRPTSTTPDPAEIGPFYTRWIAPELGLDATGAPSWSAATTARLRLGGTVRVWARARYGSVSPESLQSPLPDSPSGERDGFVLAIGVILEEG